MHSLGDLFDEADCIELQEYCFTAIRIVFNKFGLSSFELKVLICDIAVEVGMMVQIVHFSVHIEQEMLSVDMLNRKC